MADFIVRVDAILLKLRFSCIHLSLVFFFLAAISTAQTPQATPASPALSPDLVYKIQTAIRTRFEIPPFVTVAITDPKPSTTPGFDQITVTLTSSKSNTTNTYPFLISKDRKTLSRLEEIDLQKVDLPRDIMAKISLSGRPLRGNKDGKVTIVNFDDFQCPFCARMHATMFPGLLAAYGDRVRIVYRDFPLVEIHPWSMHAAVDANCLADQNNDAYWDFADYAHGNQKALGGRNPQEAFANLDGAVKDLGTKYHLDVDKLLACVKTQDESAVRASMAEAEKLGVDSTPTLFINGERFTGAVPDTDMHAIIDRALTNASPRATAANAR